ncbi:MAG: D-alanine--D-alanine ligase [Lachnospiraceae bacterium]|nr:D-alanine--D-alanine ligase [Lachnospiraceae bacterium]
MKICVLAGGTSTEREVSLISGKGIYEALKSRGHKVVLVDVYLGCPGIDPKEVFELDMDWTEGIKAIGEESPDLDSIKALRPDGDEKFCGPNVQEICAESDIVFMALHGANGEDGKLQAMFELNGIAYTGENHVSSAVCMDKALGRAVMAAAGVRVPEGRELVLGEDPGSVEYPAVVKVNNGGSSVGVYFVNNDAEFKEALKKAEKYCDRVVIERKITGREFTCGVVDGKALPLVEIKPVEGGYDYRNKYQAGATTEICPAPLDKEQTERIQRFAEKAARALHITVYARLDFLMDESGEIYCLEANTIPGMTPTSLIPQEAAAIGIDYPTLCEKLIEISLKARAKS